MPEWCYFKYIHILTHLVLGRNHWIGYYYFLCQTNEETEAQRNYRFPKVTLLVSGRVGL